jgi:hypothetical protein
VTAGGDQRVTVEDRPQRHQHRPQREHREVPGPEGGADHG